MAIIVDLAAAVGPQIKRQAGAFLAGIYEALADGKDAVRAAAIKAMDSFHAQAGLEVMVEAELVAPALSSAKPHRYGSQRLGADKAARRGLSGSALTQRLDVDWAARR